MRKLIILSFLSCFAYLSTEAQSIKTTKVADNVYMLEGDGGNICVNVGKDGVFVVDSQFEKSTPQIMRAIRAISEEPITYLVNTHHHEDHTGGNKNMASNGATVLTHTKAKDRIFAGEIKKAQAKLKSQQEADVQKYKDAGSEGKANEMAKANLNSSKLEDFIDQSKMYNMMSFSGDINFHKNGENIMIVHVPNAHTDGDVIVYFMDSNVIHTGDVFLKGRYPFMDTENGGSVDGYLSALQKILMLADKDTKIIPGHGKGIATRTEVREFHGMIRYISGQIGLKKAGGSTEAEVLKMKDLTKKYDAQGFGDGYIDRATFVKTLYNKKTASNKRQRRTKKS